MESSQLLGGLTPNSLVGPVMLDELLKRQKELVARSVCNKDWTERTQIEFELVHAIIRRNGIFV
jgi:hypothetical protein